MYKVSVVIIGLVVATLTSAVCVVSPAKVYNRYPRFNTAYPRLVRTYPPCVNRCPRPLPSYSYYSTFWDPISNKIYPGLTTVEPAEWLDLHY